MKRLADMHEKLGIFTCFYRLDLFKLPFARTSVCFAFSLSKLVFLIRGGSNFISLLIWVTWFVADCPGRQSEEAGKAEACAGCPNQQICSTAPKGPDPGNQIIHALVLQNFETIL